MKHPVVEYVFIPCYHSARWCESKVETKIDYSNIEEGITHRCTQSVTPQSNFRPVPGIFTVVCRRFYAYKDSSFLPFFTALNDEHMLVLFEKFIKLYKNITTL